MSAPRTVPLLPCGSIDDAEDFATAIGFEVTYRQGPPHPYLALRSDDGIELHYFEILGFDPSQSHGSCLVIVADPVAVLERWSAGLDQRYGTVPVQGIPRLMRPTVRTSTDAFLGFSLVDVGGNRIRVVRDATIEVEEPPAVEPLVADPEPIVVERLVVEPEPESEPEPEPAPIVATALPPRPSTFERHGVAAAPHHRLSALVYLAELATRLGRYEDARVHLAAAEMIDPEAPSVLAVRAALVEVGVEPG